MIKTIQVLLIEDNPADAYLVCEYLNDTGFAVMVTKLQGRKGRNRFLRASSRGSKANAGPDIARSEPA